MPLAFHQVLVQALEKLLPAIRLEADRLLILEDLHQASSNSNQFHKEVAKKNCERLKLTYEVMLIAVKTPWQRTGVRKCAYHCTKHTTFGKVQAANVEFAHTLPGESIRLKLGKVTANSSICSEHKKTIQEAVHAANARKIKEEDNTSRSPRRVPKQRPDNLPIPIPIPSPGPGPSLSSSHS